MSNYTREQIDALFDKGKDAPMIKLVYGDGESGWAIDLEDGHAVIANIPYEPRLNLKDVVVKTHVADAGTTGRTLRPKAGEVVWRYYAKKTVIRYPGRDAPGVAKLYYSTLWKACDNSNGLAIEGVVGGVATVSHHEDIDLRALFDAALRDAELDPAAITYRSDGDA